MPLPELRSPIVASAKDLVLMPISSQDANRVVKALHYSGKVVSNSQVHLGVFLNGKCGGALQFGPSLDKRKLIGLVSGTKWNEFIELNRMALADWLPRNGESRAIGYAMRWLRKTYPWMKWVVSFADATQCGDGTIYRASGFVLTGIKRNTQIWRAPNGQAFSRASITGHSCKEQQRQAMELARSTNHGGGGNILTSGGSSMEYFRNAGWTPEAGFQLRYIYFLHPECREQLTVPVVPFSDIRRLGASMYRGQLRAGSVDGDTHGTQP